MFHNHRVRRQLLPAFTLTEILVVILIVVTLAAVSFLVTKKLKRSANSAKAVASLRQLGSLALGLTSERGGRLPNEGHYPGQGPPNAPYEDDNSWDGSVLRYFGAEDVDFISTPPIVPLSYESMFMHGNDVQPPPVEQGGMQTARRTFVYNRALSDVPLSNVDNIARTAMLSELPWQTGGRRRVGFKSTSFMDISQMIPNPDTGEDLNPGGKFNFVFTDGHVEQLTREESAGTGTIQKPKGMWTIVGDD